MGYGAIAAGFVSAGVWILASQLPAVYPIGYLSGPPKHIEDIVTKQSRLNAWAAATTGLSVLLQAMGVAPPFDGRGAAVVAACIAFVVMSSRDSAHEC